MKSVQLYYRTELLTDRNREDDHNNCEDPKCICRTYFICLKCGNETKDAETLQYWTDGEDNLMYNCDHCDSLYIVHEDCITDEDDSNSLSSNKAGEAILSEVIEIPNPYEEVIEGDDNIEYVEQDIYRYDKEKNTLEPTGEKADPIIKFIVPPYYLDQRKYPAMTGPDGGMSCSWSCPNCKEIFFLNDK